MTMVQKHGFMLQHIILLQLENSFEKFYLFTEQRKSCQGNFKIHWYIHQKGSNSKIGELFSKPMVISDYILSFCMGRR